jgi:hypothetical protein
MTRDGVAVWLCKNDFAVTWGGISFHRILSWCLQDLLVTVVVYDEQIL